MCCPFFSFFFYPILLAILCHEAGKPCVPALYSMSLYIGIVRYWGPTFPPASPKCRKLEFTVSLHPLKVVGVGTVTGSDTGGRKPFLINHVGAI